MPPETNSGGLLDVGEVEYEEIGLSSDLGWLKDNVVTFYKGGIYLLAGQPGIGKSTLGIQIALDLGRSGIRTLFVLTEQSKADLKNRAVRMSSAWPANVTRSHPNTRSRIRTIFVIASDLRERSNLMFKTRLPRRPSGPPRNDSLKFTAILPGVWG